MRRSAVVRLTLLPVLATAAVAAADPGPPSGWDDIPLSPPGMTPETLSPPGLTPPIATTDDDACDPDDPTVACEPGGDVTVVRGGFGHYFFFGGG